MDNGKNHTKWTKLQQTVSLTFPLAEQAKSRKDENSKFHFVKY